MSTQPAEPKQNFWRTQFLLKVRVETAPAETIYEALVELRGLLAPIAGSNRAFLNAVTEVLRNTRDLELRERGVEPVRLGMLFDDVEKHLDQSMGMIRFGDDESVFAAARIAQVWAWMAIDLRDQLKDLADFVSEKPLGQPDSETVPELKAS